MRWYSADRMSDADCSVGASRAQRSPVMSVRPPANRPPSASISELPKSGPTQLTQLSAAITPASSRDDAVPALAGLAGRLERALRNFVETLPLFGRIPAWPCLQMRAN